ncbi:TPA: NAD(P)H-hydrate dehydratase [Neisseria lactamica]|uniref:NAD(P)H-hydrate dehydratase n=1 Tax=Neisseria lactamica TaxID=486 RepID=UPI0002EDF9EB|nr:NAD(P)H-hydrate dehydratase [Neisseria lactamica]
MFPVFHLSGESRRRMLQTALRFPHVFKARAEDAHKGIFGTLAVVGGAAGMSGAPILAASAAMYLGCGKVWAGFNQDTLPFAVIAGFPEIMLDTAVSLTKRQGINAWTAGCGLGTDKAAAETVAAVLARSGDEAVVLDADALNILSADAEIRSMARGCKNLILTPHPAEAARLLGTTVTQIQVDRAAAVRAIGNTFGATVVLKGHRTLVAAPDTEIYVNESGNAGLATAGSGDVLGGIIGSLLAQGVPVFEAACAGAWLHGAAADVIKESAGIAAGLSAGEIAPAARWLRNRITESM